MAKASLLDKSPPEAKYNYPVEDGVLGTPTVSIVTPRRFGMADLNDMGPWLIDRLQKKFPHLHTRMLSGWLSGAMGSNEFLFLRTDNACGMAALINEPMSAAPVIREVFVLSRNGDLNEASAFYPAFRRWAKQIGASDMVIEQFSDVPHEIVRDVVGSRVLVRETMFVRV